MAIKVIVIDDKSDINSIIEQYFNNNKAVKVSEYVLNNYDSVVISKLSKLLHSLGIPSNMKGYEYIRSAIMMVYDNPKLIREITKRLYPLLSVEYNTTTFGIERNIRHSIDISWLRGDIDLMEEIFGSSIDREKSRPTNSEYIMTIADKLRLEMDNIK